MLEMKRITRENALFLMTSGMFVITTAQIINHFVELPDLIKGSFIGIGIGLLILSITFGNFKTAH
jgi:hypothetical protein